MKLIRLEGAVAEVEFQKKQMIERYEELKQMHQKEGGKTEEWMEEVHTNGIDYFNISVHGLEDYMEHFETVESLAARLQVEVEDVERLVHTGKIKTMLVIPTSQFQNLTSPQLLEAIEEEKKSSTNG